MIPCRCGNTAKGKTCFTRKSLAKRPAEYSAQHRIPPCPVCGARKWMVDAWRTQNEIWGKGQTCNCGGYHFPHRLGSKCCYSNLQAEQHHTERYDTAVQMIP